MLKDGIMTHFLKKINKHVGIFWGQYLGKPECPYARRWGIKLGLFSIRLHHWYSSDDLRAKHDHPFWFITFVIKGSYTDISRGKPEFVCRICRQGKNLCQCRSELDPIENEIYEGLTAPCVRFRPASHIHSVRVDPGGCWTLLLTGPNVKQWGFYVRTKQTFKYLRANKYHYKYGEHPCE